MAQIFIYLLFIVITGSLRCQARGQRCPVPNTHCDCSTPGDITCININSIPRNLPRNTTYLTLRNNFFGVTLVKVQINRLRRLPLRVLDLSSNRLEIIEDRAFESLYRLKVLDISGNNIQVLTDHTFAGLKSLTYLYANDAGISTLRFQVFENVPTLEYIDLEDNKLTQIGREFTTLYNLNTILLAENQISIISLDAFSGLTQLSQLSLFGNRLHGPYSSWFRTLIKNGGKIELDRRVNSTSPVNEPNPWLCCPDVAQYHNFLVTLDSGVRSSHPQLDIACSWPVRISGRLLSTLTSKELNEVPCENYLKTTTPYSFAKVNTASTTVGFEKAPQNFLSSVGNAGAVFILLLVAAIAGILVGGCCLYYRTKRGKQKFHAVINVFRPRSTDPAASPKQDTELKTTRPYRQETSLYGATNPAERPKSAYNIPQRPARPAPPRPMSPPKVRPSSYATETKPVDMTYSNYTMETDQSEEEIWSREERKPV